MSYIVKNAVSGVFPNYALDFSRVLVSRGSLTQPSSPNVSMSAGRATNSDKGEAVFSTAAATRAAQSVELNFPADWNGDTVELYIGFASADSINVANSVYLGNHAII